MHKVLSDKEIVDFLRENAPNEIELNNQDQEVKEKVTTQAPSEHAILGGLHIGYRGKSNKFIYGIEANITYIKSIGEKKADTKIINGDGISFGVCGYVGYE